MEKVIFKHDDRQYSDWLKGDVGHISGYIANDGIPYIVVINHRTKRPVMVRFGDMIEVV